MDRFCRDRVLGHTILGSMAIVVFLAMLPIIGSLLTFAIAAVALFMGLRSLTFAMSIGLDDAWGWTRDGGMSVPLSWSDHVVLAGIAWLRRRSEATIDEQAAGAIQVLPPNHPARRSRPSFGHLCGGCAIQRQPLQEDQQWR